MAVFWQRYLDRDNRSLLDLTGSRPETKSNRIVIFAWDIEMWKVTLIVPYWHLKLARNEDREH